ncbi:hypothetical protein FQA39_LY14140 [Lamprigera yunnana]|nr:hypothetical protein FQA39_LY14140 [Lamprigera yunnana]
MSRLNSNMHPLLNGIVLNALFDKKIYNVIQFVETEIKQIAAITNLQYKNIVEIRKHLINKYSAITNNGLDYYNELITKSALFSTGIKSLDAILEGGLMTGNVYEICGLPASGKTQFCLSLLKHVAQKFNFNSYYIDTKRDFSAKRLKVMLDESKYEKADLEQVMSKILINEINTPYELINYLYKIKNLLHVKKLKLRLIIIDSLPPLFLQISNFSKSYSLMNDFANVMRFLAKEFHIAFVVVNVKTVWNEGDFGVEGNVTEKLGLGKYWFNVPNTRLMIKKCTRSSDCTITILKSNRLAKGLQCSVGISDAGVV